MSFATRRGEVTAAMAPSNFGYSLREAGSHFFRNLGTSLGAVITIFLSLFIIGLFIMGSALVNSVIGTVEQQVTINAFISDDATDEQIEAFRDKLESWENVSSVDFKTKEDALADYTGNISNNAEATLAALDGENPLPRSFVIEVGRLFQVTTYIRIAAVVLVGLLTFIAFIFINNTIRLSITARRREIGIMRLVGASNSFIRGPFITEGVMQSILGALLAIGALELIRNFGIPAIQNAVSFISFALPIEMYLVTYAALVIVGIVIGLFGSAIAMGRYLKV